MIAFTANKIYIFNVLYLQYQIGIQYQAVLMEVSSGSFSTTAITSVNDAQVSGYKLFIASYGIDVYSFDSGGISFLSNIDQQSIKFTIVSFAVINETIYAIAKDKGLVLYKKTNNDGEYHISLLYEHSFMEKLFFYVNSFNGKKYIGVFFTPSSWGSEFYMEIYLENGTVPYINRIFTASERDTEITKVLDLDLFFLYFYDKRHNKIYSFRKGILNKISLIA